MIVHCNMRFKPIDIWFLYDTDIFFDRKLEIYRCPVCNKDMCKLIEVRKTDNKVFEQYYYKQPARNKIKELYNDINYTYLNFRIEKGEPLGFIYGENKEIKRKDHIEIIQKACDFYGNKRVEKKITVHD